MKTLKLLFRIGFVLIVFVIMFSCQTKKEKYYIKLNGFTQGTTFSIVYHHPKGFDFASQVDSILLAIDSSMSVYNTNSIITAFNNSPSGIEVDSMLARIVSLSLQITQETEGAFDITVGPLVKAWGFHIKQGEMPTHSQVADMLTIIGSDKIWLNGLFLGKANPRVMIDVNAIAQGYTVDVIGEFFEKNGVTDYLVEVGGEVRTLGRNNRNALWTVGVDKPVDDAISGENFQTIIAITNKSLVTSGNYRKFYVRDGIKYSHSIDPKTGYPANHTLLSATVIDETGARADALATAFMVMGLEKSKQWLKQYPLVDAYFIYSDSLGDYQVWMTHGMQKMIID